MKIGKWNFKGVQVQITTVLRRNALLVSTWMSLVVFLAGPGRARASGASTSLAPLSGAFSPAEPPTEVASDGRRAYIVVLRDPSIVRSAAATPGHGVRPLRSLSAADVDQRVRQLSQKQDAFESDMRSAIPGFQAGARFHHV